MNPTDTENPLDAFSRYRRSREAPSRKGMAINVLLAALALAAGSVWYFAAPLLANIRLAGGTIEPPPASSEMPDGLLTVVQLDVGQSDATFIHTPSGYNILIDVGEGGNPENTHSKMYPAAMEVVRPFLIMHGILHIDLIILTHPDSDHGGGMAELIDWIYQSGGSVGMMLDAGVGKPARFYELILQAVEKYRIPYFTVLDPKSGKPAEYEKGAFPGFEGGTLIGQVVVPDPSIAFQILGPIHRIGSADGDKSNDNSIITRIQCGEFSFLAAGDAEDEQQQAVVEFWGDRLNSTVTFAPHHGSKTSINPFWLQKVNPRIVSSSSHPPIYGHPPKLVLDTWKSMIEPDPLYLRTDLNGDIWYRTDGKKLGIRTQLGYKGDEAQWTPAVIRQWKGHRRLEADPPSVAWEMAKPLEGFDHF